MRGESQLKEGYGKGAGRHGGFTLVELTVVAALIALLAAMAEPSFVAWHVRERVDAGAGALFASLAHARSAAIRRGERVVVCRIEADGNCGDARGMRERGSVDWASGWAVVVEARSGRTVLRRQPRAAAIGIRGGAADIRFTPPAGQVIGGFRSFEVAPEGVAPLAGGHDRRRCISIAAGGRARMGEGACPKSA
jgi:type IV fimbrial biogenesis protein FimT